MTASGTSSLGRLLAGRLAFWAAVLIIVAAVVLGYFTVRAFNQAVEPELNNRSRLIGTIVRANIQRALDLGIPLAQIRGTGKYLAETLETFPEVLRLSIRSSEGVIVSLAERSVGKVSTYDLAGDQSPVAPQPSLSGEAFIFPILTGNRVVGEIVVEGDRSFVEQQFQNVFLDVMVVVLVAVLVAFEITLAVVAASMSKPLDRLHMLLERQSRGDFSSRLIHDFSTSLDRVTTRFSFHSEDLNNRYRRLLNRLSDKRIASLPLDRLRNVGRRFGLSGHMSETLRLADIVDIRLPLFFFVIAEELSKPFLPLYIQSMAGADFWINEAIIISLPLIAYLISLVLLSSVAGMVTARFPARWVFLTALVPVAISHVGLSLSQSVVEIVFWRGIAGAGYALATIACQDYALRAVQIGHRARATSGFVAVIVGGTLCGTAIGGVLADRIGQSNVFLVGAALICIAGVIAIPMLAGERRAPFQAGGSPIAGSGLWSALGNIRLVTLLVGIAIPANVLIAAFLWYLVPLMLSEAGSAPADIGRALMLYYLAIVLLGPRVAGIVNRLIGASTLAVIGGLVSGLALVVMNYWQGYWPVTFAIVLAGIGHAMVRVPQVEVALHIADTGHHDMGPSAMLDALRTFERVGCILGLLLTALIVSEFGYANTAAFIGYCVVFGAVIFAVASRLDRWKRRTQE